MFALVTVAVTVFRIALRTGPSNLSGRFQWLGRAAFLTSRAVEDAEEETESGETESEDTDETSRLRERQGG